MEEEAAEVEEGGDNSSAKQGIFSPKVARPKLPNFSSRTWGHGHHRAKTDPGEAEEIKNLMEEIKKWKEGGSMFDKNPIRPKVIKPRTIPKAHSTHTSPRTSPPPSSPNVGARSSSLNRNRSRSLKLLTDKLKSGRAGSTSPSLLILKSSAPVPDDSLFKCHSADADKTEPPRFPVKPSPEQCSSGEAIGNTCDNPSDSIQEKTVLNESIPEKDEDEDKEEKTSALEDSRASSRHPQRIEIQLKVPTTKLGEEDPGGDSDNADAPQSVVSSFTLHPIDRNSEFLRLRQTAPKRRPGYAGLSLPKSKIPFLSKPSGSQDDKTEDPVPTRKPKLELPLPGGSARKISGTKFPTPQSQSKATFRDDGSFDYSGFMSYRSPSTESPPPFPEELEDNPVGSGQSEDPSALEDQADSQTDEAGTPKEQTPSPVTDNVPLEFEAEKQPDKRNGKGAKHKSKSDPSGSKTRELGIAAMFNSSQSQSFPILLREEQRLDNQDFPKEEGDAEGRDREEVPGDSELGDIQGRRVPTSLGDLPQSTSTSVSEDMLLSPQSETNSDIVGDSMMRSREGLEYQGQGTEQEDNLEMFEGEEGLASMASSGYSHNNSSPSTPHSQSPVTTLDREKNLLSIPQPKRPILRSVSSASVLNRDRNYSGGNMKDKDVIRKHSITGAEDNSMPSDKPMEFIPIGDGGALTVSMPAVWNAERGPSESPEREGIKDKRYHIVEELYKNEKEYVEALRLLKERYMDPLKNMSSIDETVIDNIFYMIPEILTHHLIYLNFLNDVWTKWNTDTSTVGDIIQKTFSGHSVQDSYLSFVENYKTSGKVIENAILTKTSIQKFVEQCQKESGSKLSMKDLIVRPIQRIPRYELLIQRLLDNTPGDHPDYVLLKEAEKVMHDFAMKIGNASESQHEEGQQETLKKLELLLITDLAVPDRAYLRHDMVQILNKKDQCCIWMFSDLIIISSVKRKSGPVTRKVSVILKSPTGQDFAENVKQKLWLRVGLDDIEIVKSQGSLTRKSTLDREQVEEDLEILSMMSDLTSKLNCSHSELEEVLKDMTGSLNKQLSYHNLRCSLLDSTKMELLVTTQERVLPLEVNFLSGEKRSAWESAFLDAKQKLSLLSDKRAPEFLQPLQITKTRAGMQFSCAAPIDGLNASGYRDVWVCNSDGYVGHMCLLSLQPEPIVTLNTPVPGCNARILCIGAVPAHTGSFRRKSSAKRSSRKRSSSPGRVDGPHISVEEVDSAITEEEPQQVAMGDGEGIDTFSEEGYQSDSESSTDDDEEFSTPSNKLYVDDYVVKRPQPSQITQSSPDPISITGNWSQDPLKSTMWLGTEDGCIHIFQCTDNIKTTKNKLKIQLGYPVFCIVYLDNKVFVSLANGDLIVYKRDTVDGVWDTENPYTRSIGSVTAPIVKMLAVAGKLWCGCQNNICVINPLTLSSEVTFSIHPEASRSVQCIVTSGQGVWVAPQQSSKVLLYHATTYEFLLEVNISQAVNQKLQAADDIIRQHKAACLRITALLVCKDLLWLGTSAGVILTVPMPKITSTSNRGSLNVPMVTGLVYGHTGHVRFLTCVEMSNSNSVLPHQPGRSDSHDSNDPPKPHDHHRRSSVATLTATLATRMLVISGGDGYEDFRNNAANEAAGRDDSTNHLLLWQV